MPVKINAQTLLMGLGIVVGAYIVLRLVVPKTLSVASDVVSGDILPEDSEYRGTGIIALPAATANAASGGLLSRFGSFLGQRAADARDFLTGQGDPNK